MPFDLHAPYEPTGDQPDAISKIVEGIHKGYRHQVLLGATGTGKTFTVANVIQQVQLPTLVMAHNKTLAAQLYAEFKEFFPNNAVEFFGWDKSGKAHPAGKAGELLPPRWRS